MEAVEKEVERVTKKHKAFHKTTTEQLDKLIANIIASSSQQDMTVQLKHASTEIQSSMKEYYAAMSKLSKSLEKRFTQNLDLAARPEAFEGKEKLLDQAVALHLIREGNFDLGSHFCHEAGLKLEDSLKDQFAEMYTIVEALKNKDTQPALEWAKKHRTELNRRGSHLEFQLHQLRFLSILLAPSQDAHGTPAKVANKQVMDALAYAKRELSGFGGKYLKDIQRLMCSLLYTTPRPFHDNTQQYFNTQNSAALSAVFNKPDPLKRSPYADLTSPSHWTDLQQQFMHDYCALLGLSNDPPLQVCVDLGATAIPTMIKLKSLFEERRKERPKIEMWSISDELPVEIPIPRSNRYHSIFACPVSREQTTDRNPPMMLPCGHIISRESLVRLAKGKPGGAPPTLPSTQDETDPFAGVNMNTKVKCPYCPTESPVGHALRVRF